MNLKLPSPLKSSEIPVTILNSHFEHRLEDLYDERGIHEFGGAVGTVRPEVGIEKFGKSN